MELCVIINDQLLLSPGFFLLQYQIHISIFILLKSMTYHVGIVVSFLIIFS